IYVYTFHQYDIHSIDFDEFISILRSYVRKFFRDRYGIDVYIRVHKSNDERFYLYVRIFNNKDAGFYIYDDGRIDYAYGYIDIDEIRDIVRRLGSMAYGVALALIETLSNDPRCVGGECGSFINSLIDGLSRVTYFPIPDVEIYESVKDLINRGGIPFKSEVTVDDENIRRDIMDKKNEFNRILCHGENKESIYIIGRYEESIYVVDQDIRARIEIECGYGKIHVVFFLPSIIDDVSMDFYVIDMDRPKIYMRMYVSVSKDFDKAVDVIANWYNYVTKALEKGIEDLEKLRDEKNVDRNKINVLKDYLKHWINIINRYRDEFEKNKIYR
ncbi:MAG: hypothetical protein QXL19_10980, partial [Ignisphaera sp.]